MIDTPERNREGNSITREFMQNGNRYHFDFQECREEDGWVQFDTDQDDWYFGVWVHPERREVITYAEGDVTRVQCETPEQYAAEIHALSKAYGAAPAFTTLDPETGTLTKHYQNRNEFLPDEPGR